jgi:hypothetical protein
MIRNHCREKTQKREAFRKKQKVVCESTAEFRRLGSTTIPCPPKAQRTLLHITGPSKGQPAA